MVCLRDQLQKFSLFNSLYPVRIPIIYLQGAQDFKDNEEDFAKGVFEIPG